MIIPMKLMVYFVTLIVPQVVFASNLASDKSVLELCDKPAREYVMNRSGKELNLEKFKPGSTRFHRYPLVRVNSKKKIEFIFDYSMPGFAEPCANALVELSFKITDGKRCNITTHENIAGGDCRQEP